MSARERIEAHLERRRRSLGSFDYKEHHLLDDVFAVLSDLTAAEQQRDTIDRQATYELSVTRGMIDELKRLLAAAEQRAEALTAKLVPDFTREHANELKDILHTLTPSGTALITSARELRDRWLALTAENKRLSQALQEAFASFRDSHDATAVSTLKSEIHALTAELAQIKADDVLVTEFDAQAMGRQEATIKALTAEAERLRAKYEPVPPPKNLYSPERAVAEGGWTRKHSPLSPDAPAMDPSREGISIDVLSPKERQTIDDYLKGKAT